MNGYIEDDDRSIPSIMVMGVGSVHHIGYACLILGSFKK
jgi:hypothetical protein